MPASSPAERAVLSLYGTAIGDGIGEMMFGRAESAHGLITGNELPAGPWFHTDDTEMAISVTEVLLAHGAIDQEALAAKFLQRYQISPDRGYGSGARRQLRRMEEGVPWRTAAAETFEGQGSLGNGSAMRATPVGAWFADDRERLVQEARASATVTHTHAEGIAGAVAVALAAAAAWNFRTDPSNEATERYFDFILTHTPEGETKRGIRKAHQLLPFKSPEAAARILGNGGGITCPDTVPFVLWAAAKNRLNLREALAATASVGGDIDTNCAIVGGIVSLSVGWAGVPVDWADSIEPLPIPR